MDRDAAKEWVKAHFSLLLAGFCVLSLILLLLFIRGNPLITVIACVSIVALGIESRAKTFDRTVSMLVIYSLAIGFMLFG